MRLNTSALLSLGATVLLTAHLGAQAMSSKNYFMSATELASGGSCLSTNYVQKVTLGNGITPLATGSKSYRLTGGFPATLNVSPIGQPWITHVSPNVVKPLGGAVLTVHGINLGLGTAPAIKVRDQKAKILTRNAGTITAQLPKSVETAPRPGYPGVTVESTKGDASLTRGLGVLPLLFCDPAPAPNTAFDIVFKGSRGGTIIWAVGALTNAPVWVPPMIHGLELNPIAMVVLPGFAITDPSGEFRFRVQPVNYVGPIWAQALLISSDKGYTPGSFSNLLRL